MLKVGVIGLGAMGKNHARIYSRFANVELVGVADIDFSLAKNIAKQFNTRPFSDYRDLLKLNLDAVSIVVPTFLHKDVTVDVANAGVNILLEKPISKNIAEAREIIGIAKSNGIKFMIGHIERFNPIIPLIKKFIEESEVSLIEITRIGPYPPRVKDIGVVIDIATHDIDLIRYLTGSEFKHIRCLKSRSLAAEEDTAILIFEMTNGILARVTVNWLTPFKVRDISIATKEKYVKASLLDQKIIQYSRYGENNSYIVNELKVPHAEALDLELKAFIASILNNEIPPITGEDGLMVLDIALKCLNKWL